MVDIVFNTDDGPSLTLDDTERALMDEISIKPQTRNIPLVKPKPKPKVKFMEPGMDAFINQSKKIDEQMYEQGPPPPGMMMDEEDEFGQMGGGGGPQMQEQEPSEGYKTIEDEKADLLNKLARLQKKGFSPNKKFGAHSDIEELRTEYKRIVYGIEADQSVKFQRRMLMACVSGLEFMNKRYDPFDLQLDGWSESMMENLDDYDGVFEDLYAKYRDKVNVAPEIKLVMMVGGSAMMFHLSNSMFKAVPNMNQVLQKNPELVKNMMDAIKTTAPPSSQPSNGVREMRGPGIDLSQLLGGFGVPPPMNSRQPAPKPPTIHEDDQISDIVSVSGSEGGPDTRDISIKNSGSKKRRSSKKNEVTL
jgi:hypothetical protein